MYKYILKRLLQVIPVVIGVSFFIFVAMDLTAGDVTSVLGGDTMTVEQLAELRARLGLDRPLLVRYFEYMWGLLHGDLGTSYITGQPVLQMFLQKLPATLKLCVGSMVVCIGISLPLGIVAARKHGSLIDNGATAFAMLGLSIPDFWLGLMLIIAFSLHIKLFPSYGDEGFISIILPSITCGTAGTAILTRTTRSSMLDVLSQDYLRTARAKGVPEKKVINVHALKNALIPILTIAGGQFAAGMGGAVLTETVFSWPGVGKMIVDHLNNRDTPVVTGFIIMKCILISLTLLAVDILYAYVDPRIKAQYAKAGGKKK